MAVADGSIAWLAADSRVWLGSSGVKDPNRLASVQHMARCIFLVYKATFIIRPYIDYLSMCLGAGIGELD